MEPLETLADLALRWPADNVALCVVTPAGIQQSFGDVHRPFELASVTKLLSATAVLVAIEEGSVSLNSPVGPPGSTVRHLLSHASGLSLETDQLLAEPATRRIYSNYGFEVLGEHVRQATGLELGTYLSEGVCEPLGMLNTVLDGSPARAAVSTASDLSAWVQEMLQPGAVLARQTLEMAISPQFADLAGVLPGYGQQRPNPWGLGFEIRGTKAPHWTGRTNSPQTFGHFGQSGTFLWVDPVAEIGLLGLGDLNFGDWAIDLWPHIADWVLADQVLANLITAQRLI